MKIVNKAANTRMKRLLNRLIENRAQHAQEKSLNCIEQMDSSTCTSPSGKYSLTKVHIPNSIEGNFMNISRYREKKWEGKYLKDTKKRKRDNEGKEYKKYRHKSESIDILKEMLERRRGGFMFDTQPISGGRHKNNNRGQKEQNIGQKHLLTVNLNLNHQKSKILPIPDTLTITNANKGISLANSPNLSNYTYATGTNIRPRRNTKLRYYPLKIHSIQIS